MAYLNPDDAYKPHIRLTETKRDQFGSKSTNSQDSDPEELVESIDRDLAELRSCVETVGTSLETTTIREEFDHLRSIVKGKLINAKEELASKRSSKGDSIVLQRLTNQLGNQVNQFEELLKSTKTKMESSYADSFSGGVTSVIGHQTTDYTENDDEVEVTKGMDQTHDSGLAEIETRQTEITNLERDINDLHDINTNLNQMVVKQGDVVDNIEMNTEKASTRVKHAAENAQEAVAIKRNSRTLIWLILGIAAVVIIIIIIIVIILAVVLSS